MDSKLSDHLTGAEAHEVMDEIKANKENEMNDALEGMEVTADQVIDVDPEGVLPPEVAEKVDAEINQPELTPEEEEKYRAEALAAYVKQLSTKMRFKRNFATEYHPGYTKPTLEARTQKRRKKNKQARKSRQANR